jgi:hypothetical protein
VSNSNVKFVGGDDEKKSKGLGFRNDGGVGDGGEDGGGGSDEKGTKRKRLSPNAKDFKPSGLVDETFKFPSFRGMSADAIKLQLLEVRKKKLAMDSVYAELNAVENETLEVLKLEKGSDSFGFIGISSSSSSTLPVYNVNQFNPTSFIPLPPSYPMSAPFAQNPVGNSSFPTASNYFFNPSNSIPQLPLFPGSIPVAHNSFSSSSYPFSVENYFSPSGTFPPAPSLPSGFPTSLDPTNPIGSPLLSAGTNHSTVISPELAALVNQLVREKMKEEPMYECDYSSEFKATLKMIDEGEPVSAKQQDSNFWVWNADKTRFVVPRVDTSTMIAAKESLFASRILNPEAFAIIGEYSGLILKFELINRLGSYAENWALSRKGASPGFKSLTNLSFFETTHIWANSSVGNYDNFIDFLFGKFTNDRLLSTSGLNLQSKLNIFSPVKGPWPKSENEVDTDFVLKVVHGWEQWFVAICGEETSRLLGVITVVKPSRVFEDTIRKIRDTGLKHLPSIYFLHLFNDVLFEWFRLTSNAFRIDGIYYAFENRSSALLLLRDMLEEIDFRSMDLNLYYAQSAKGKILKCFISESFVKNELKYESRGEVTPTISKNKLGSQVCLTNACAIFMNEKSIGVECFLVGGVCARNHISTEKEFMDSIPSLLNAISKSRTITPVTKLDLSSKINTIQEFGFK